MNDPVEIRDRQRRLHAALLEGEPHFTTATGASSSSSVGSAVAARRFHIVDLDKDERTNGSYLICRPWDGETERGVITPRVQSPPPPRCFITTAGDLTHEGTDWLAAGVVLTDRVKITDAKENGDGHPEADKTYEIESVTQSTIRLAGWAVSGVVDADFAVGPDTVLVWRPHLLQRPPHDSVSFARAESPPRGTIVGPLLNAGVDWEAVGVVTGDNVQITDATQVNGDGDTVELLDDTYPVLSAGATHILLGGWLHGEFETDCKFRVGPPGERSPRNDIQYLYSGHDTRTGKRLVEQGEDPGARERQQITPDYVVGDEVYAIAFPFMAHGDQRDENNVLWLEVSNVHAWAMRDL